MKYQIFIIAIVLTVNSSICQIDQAKDVSAINILDEVIKEKKSLRKFKAIYYTVIGTVAFTAANVEPPEFETIGRAYAFAIALYGISNLIIPSQIEREKKFLLDSVATDQKEEVAFSILERNALKNRKIKRFRSLYHGIIGIYFLGAQPIKDSISYNEYGEIESTQPSAVNIVAGIYSFAWSFYHFKKLSIVEKGYEKYQSARN